MRVAADGSRHFTTAAIMFAKLQISRAPHISKSQSNRGMRSRMALIAMMPTFRNAQINDGRYAAQADGPQATNRTLTRRYLPYLRTFANAYAGARDDLPAASEYRCESAQADRTL